MADSIYSAVTLLYIYKEWKSRKARTKIHKTKILLSKSGTSTSKNIYEQGLPDTQKEETM